MKTCSDATFRCRALWQSNKFKANWVIRHISIAIHVFVLFYLAPFVPAPSRLLCIPAQPKESEIWSAPCSDAAIQPRAHTHQPSTGSGALSFLLSLRFPPAFESGATHTSSPRTRTPEFIYFISAAGAAAAPTATGVQRWKRNCCNSTMGTIWMQRAAGYRKWRFVAIYIRVLLWGTFSNAVFLSGNELISIFGMLWNLWGIYSRVVKY